MSHALHVHDTAGDGPALVLVHAFPLHGGLFEGQRPLAEDRRLVIPDLPGFGRSAPPMGPGSMPALAGAVCLAMDRARLKTAALCGVSIGGYILLEMMRRCPERVDALILCDTRAEADAPEALAAREEGIALARTGKVRQVAGAMPPKLLAPTSYADDGIRGAVEGMAAEAHGLGVAFALEAMRDRPDSRPDLASIDVPTLVLVGEQDALTPPDAAKVMADGIPGAKLKVLPGAGHLSPLEAPEAFNAAVRAFLSQ